MEVGTSKLRLYGCRLAAFFFVFAASAHAVSPLKGVPHTRQVLETRARDGVKSYLFYYVPTGVEPSGPVILKEPGFGQAPPSLESVVHDFFRQTNARVLIGQVREAGREYKSGRGRYNGPQEVYFNDIAQHIVEAFAVSGGEPISLWGNSNGANGIAAVLTNEAVRKDVLRRAQAMAPRDAPIQKAADLDGTVIRGVELVGAPGDFKYLHERYPNFAGMLRRRLPLISKTVRMMPGPTIDVLHRAVDAASGLRAQGRWRHQSVAWALEAGISMGAALATQFGLFDAKKISKNGLRRLVKKGLSAIPKESGLGLLKGIAEGALRGRTGGQYENPEIMAAFDGKPLIRWEDFPATVPLRLVSPEEDPFCPMPQQRDIFERAGSKHKSWLRVPGKGHVFFMEDDLFGVNAHSVDFYRDPLAIVGRENKVKLRFGAYSCERAILGSEGEWDDFRFSVSILEWLDWRPWKWAALLGGR